METILARGRTLLGSRTIWGGVILIANTVFAMNMPEELASQIADTMNMALASIGGALILIGRLGAKPVGQ